MTRKTLAAAVLAAALFLPVRAEALETDDLLALVAMPLAVAAVSEVTDVPMSDLMDVVTLLNDADVPPVQFVEVVRYVPVALVVEEPVRTPFVEFVRTRYQQGIVGTPLVTEIEREIRFYGVPEAELDVVSSPEREIDFIPVPVRTRLTEQPTSQRSNHPHGGPPGQLKKELGLKTGAEVVHGERNDRDDDERVAREPKRAKQPKEEKVAKADRAPKVKMHTEHGNSGGGKGHGGGGGKGHGAGGGGGKGKGHGKGKG